MASNAETIEFLEDQIAGDLDVRFGKMFGEYCVYVDGKVAGFVCDDTLFLKPSDAVITGTHPGHPYPGSKEYHEVPGELLENREWLVTALRATADALPAPKPKTARPGGRGR